jgi:predicted dehydrogenase
MVATADRRGLLLVEAFHWRYHPVAERMIELSQRIGSLERVAARFSARIPTDNVRFDLRLAGGSFMDLGCYCMHMVRARLEDGSTVDEVLDVPTSYEYQLRAFCRAVEGTAVPLTGGTDSIDNMRAIDRVYMASGLGIRR